MAHGLRGASHIILGYASILEGRSGDARDRRALAAIVASAQRVSAIAEAMSLLAPGTPSRAGDGSDRDIDGDVVGPAGVGLQSALARTVARQQPVFALRDVRLELAAQEGADLGVPAPVVAAIVDLLLAWALARTESGSAVQIDVSREPSTVAWSLRIGVGRPSGPDDAWTIASELSRAHGTTLTLDEHAGVVTLAGAESRERAGEAGHARQIRERCGGSATSAGATLARSTPTGATRVLYADDDPAGRALVELTVESIGGCALVLAASGGEAAALLRDERFDVAVVDHHLGDALGLDVIEPVRQHAGDECRMVLLTGDRDRGLEDRATALGVDVLHKPIDVGDLVQLLVAARSRRVR